MWINKIRNRKKQDEALETENPGWEEQASATTVPEDAQPADGRGVQKRESTFFRRKSTASKKKPETQEEQQGEREDTGRDNASPDWITCKKCGASLSKAETVAGRYV